MTTMAKVFLAGHRGMVGSALLRELLRTGEHDVILRNRNELDLIDQSSVRTFFKSERPERVILAAAKVGGIFANNAFPAEFIYENLMIESNVIHQAYLSGVKQLMLLGSSCIYPRDAAQPMEESALLTGPLEPTNEPYAVAKIAGIKLCESYNRQYGVDYRCVMPSNLYGPGDNFHRENSHVLPALIHRFHDAMMEGRQFVEIWGTGKPMREFLHVDDMAQASLYVMNLKKEDYDFHTTPMVSHINVGSGEDVSILDLAHLVAKTVGFTGQIICDLTKPDGCPRKLMDVSRLAQLGWRSKITLEKGLAQTYRWFLQNYDTVRT